MAEADRSPGAPVRVLLVDDDESFLESLQPLIEHQPELMVVAKARDGWTRPSVPTSSFRTPS